MGDILSGICPVVHEKKLDILGVLNEEDLVAGGNEMSRLLVATETDLLNGIQVRLHSSSGKLAKCSICEIRKEHTPGITAWPLNRLRTRLSIPLGFRHDGSTHLNLSDWWRLKRFGSA